PVAGLNNLHLLVQVEAGGALRQDEMLRAAAGHGKAARRNALDHRPRPYGFASTQRRHPCGRKAAQTSASSSVSPASRRIPDPPRSSCAWLTRSEIVRMPTWQSLREAGQLASMA